MDRTLSFPRPILYMYTCIFNSNGIYVKYKLIPVFMGQVGEGCGLKYWTATKLVPGAIHRVRTLEGF